MDDLVEIWEIPVAEEKCMLAGWHQWADAGAVSSGLLQYLIHHVGARKIGQIKPDGFYLFQIPGTRQFLRPEIKLEEGYRKKLKTSQNEFFYRDDRRKGLIVFLGDEPHLDAERYADAFLDAAQVLGVKRVAALGGVYSEVPYDKDREVTCIYSLPRMKDELSKYAVKFSDYEGGVSIGTYIADRAERRGIEYAVFYASVPAYDFQQLATAIQGVGVETDFKAWYDLMRRLNHLFGLNVDLAELEKQSAELSAAMDARLDELESQTPQVREYMEKVTASFEERPFMPLDVWERELGDLLE